MEMFPTLQYVVEKAQKCLPASENWKILAIEEFALPNTYVYFCTFLSSYQAIANDSMTIMNTITTVTITWDEELQEYLRLSPLRKEVYEDISK